MSQLYSPTAWCKEAHTMVFTSQTQAQCAREHAGPPGRLCPLGANFANIHASHRGRRSTTGAE